jgi:hypothetical protein
MCDITKGHIMNKKRFNLVLYNFCKSDIDKDRAWTIYLNFLKLFKEKNGVTIEYLEKIGCMNNSQKLIWRNKLAEKGIELTPDQVEDYVFILSLAITEFWKAHE